MRAGSIGWHHSRRATSASAVLADVGLAAIAPLPFARSRRCQTPPLDANTPRLAIGAVSANQTPRYA
jgi:hypothetical protein